MTESDFNDPYLALDSMGLFTAIQPSDARKYGKTVRAFALSNREYQRRFNQLGTKNNMKPPPGSHIHIMPGYLVVRKLGTPAQYETWMPDQVFDELYQKQKDSVPSAQHEPENA
jgi:hypothetical protein